MNVGSECVFESIVAKIFEAAGYSVNQSVKLQRQQEGITIAKREGKYRGSQKKYVGRYLFEEFYKQWKKGDITQKYMCEKLNISRRTLYTRIKQYEETKKRLNWF